VHLLTSQHLIVLNLFVSFNNAILVAMLVSM